MSFTQELEWLLNIVGKIHDRIPMHCLIISAEIWKCHSSLS